MKKTALGLVLTVFFLAGCTSSPSMVNANPTSFRDKVFPLSGRIEQTLTVPGTQLSLFLLGDGQSSLVGISLSPKPRDSQVTIQARLLGFTDGPTALGTEEKQLIRSLLIKNKVVPEALADLTLSAVEAGVKTLGGVIKKLYLVLEV